MSCRNPTLLSPEINEEDDASSLMNYICNDDVGPIDDLDAALLNGHDQARLILDEIADDFQFLSDSVTSSRVLVEQIDDSTSHSFHGISIDHDDNEEEPDVTAIANQLLREGIEAENFFHRDALSIHSDNSNDLSPDSASLNFDQDKDDLEDIIEAGQRRRSQRRSTRQRFDNEQYKPERSPKPEKQSLRKGRGGKNLSALMQELKYIKNDQDDIKSNDKVEEQGDIDDDDSEMVKIENNIESEKRHDSDYLEEEGDDGEDSDRSSKDWNYDAENRKTSKVIVKNTRVSNKSESTDDGITAIKNDTTKKRKKRVSIASIVSSPTKDKKVDVQKLIKERSLPKGGDIKDEVQKSLCKWCGTDLRDTNAEPPSIYCSEKCIHEICERAKVSYGEDNPNLRIFVLDSSTGNLLGGPKAPQLRHLDKFILKHPNCYPVLSKDDKHRPDLLASASNRHGKEAQTNAVTSTQLADSTTTSQIEQFTNIRNKVRRTLTELLIKRLKCATDLYGISDSDAKKKAVAIEEALHQLRDVSKYKRKYKHLLINLKNSHNRGLFRRIILGEISADRIANMDVEEMNSSAMSTWTGPSKKAPPNSNASRQTLQKKLPRMTVLPSTADALLDNLICDTTSQHKSHLFDVNCRICTGKGGGSNDSSEECKQKLSTNNNVIKQYLKDDLASLNDTSDLNVSSDLISAPPISNDPLQLGRASPEYYEAVGSFLDNRSSNKRRTALSEENVVQRAESSVPSPASDSRHASDSPRNREASVWRGFVVPFAGCKLMCSAYAVSGPAHRLKPELPDQLQIVGRIGPDVVWDYIRQIKVTNSKDIIVLKMLEPLDDEDRQQYQQLYDTMMDKQRYSVVGNCNPKYVKDFYFIPLAAHISPPPDVMPFNGPGLDDNRRNLILAVVVRHRQSKSGLVAQVSDNLSPAKLSKSSSKKSNNSNISVVEIPVSPAHNAVEGKKMSTAMPCNKGNKSVHIEKNVTEDKSVVDYIRSLIEQIENSPDPAGLAQRVLSDIGRAIVSETTRQHLLTELNSAVASQRTKLEMLNAQTQQQQMDASLMQGMMAMMLQMVAGIASGSDAAAAVLPNPPAPPDVDDAHPVASSAQQEQDDDDDVVILEPTERKRKKKKRKHRRRHQSATESESAGDEWPSASSNIVKQHEQQLMTAANGSNINASTPLETSSTAFHLKPISSDHSAAETYAQQTEKVFENRRQPLCRDPVGPNDQRTHETWRDDSVQQQFDYDWRAEANDTTDSDWAEYGSALGNLPRPVFPLSFSQRNDQSNQQKSARNFPSRRGALLPSPGSPRGGGSCVTQQNANVKRPRIDYGDVDYRNSVTDIDYRKMYYK